MRFIVQNVGQIYGIIRFENSSSARLIRKIGRETRFGINQGDREEGGGGKGKRALITRKRGGRRIS